MKRMRVLVAMLVTSVCLGLAVTGVRPETVRAQAPVFGYSVRSDADDLLYRINMQTGVATPIGPVGFGDVEAVAFDLNGNLFGVDDITNQLIRINLNTGAGTVVGPLGVAITDMGLTFDDRGNLFMSVDAPQNFYRLNPNTGAATLIGPQGQQVTALAFCSGVVYGLGGDNTDNLVRMNTSTGAATEIGPLVNVTLSDGGLDFDNDGTLWGIEDTGDIFTVNPETGLATLAATTLAGFEGLAISANCGAAAAVVDVFNNPNNDDEKRKETELQRQQRKHTNKLGFEDYELEGNVTAVGTTGGPFIVVANRDGLVMVRLIREATKARICVGYYVHVAGEKHHELLYDGEDVSVDKKSDSRECLN